jgi:hypothetical protein
MSQKKIKVAFDMDGVLLYNPTRIFRSLIAKGKKVHVLSREELEFYHPAKPSEELFWLMAHWSSFRLNPGFKELLKLVKNNQIEAYVVSARFACLQKNSQRWLKKMQAANIFKAVYLNDQDEQPHLFKERIAKKLAVDYFVEDNFDVASHLSQSLKSGEDRVLWLSNKLDYHRAFKHKFKSFRQVMAFLSAKCD